MVPIDTSTAGCRRMEPAPRRQSMELRKRAKLNFVLMYVITSEYESSFLTLIVEANLCMVFDADGPAPPVKEKINGQKWLSRLRLSFARISASCGLVVFLGIRYASWATLRIRIKHFHFKDVLLKLESKKPLA